MIEEKKLKNISVNTWKSMLITYQRRLIGVDADNRLQASTFMSTLLTLYNKKKTYKPIKFF
jgi:hypothetical protein